MGGASQSGSKLALISPARADRRVYNFGPVAAADAAAAACALLNYTATPNLINLEIVLARSVSRETTVLGPSVAASSQVLYGEFQARNFAALQKRRLLSRPLARLPLGRN